MIEIAAVVAALAGVGMADAAAPDFITVATARGVSEVAVSHERGHPTLAVPQLSQLLPVTGRASGEWAIVTFANQPFRFLLDAAVVVYQGRAIPLVGGAYVTRDTMFVPLQWVTALIPRYFSEAYHYDPYGARFEEVRFAPVISRAPPIAEPSYEPVRPGGRAARTGFYMKHKVVVDAGHGGKDAGNPGRFFPRGVQEKHLTLAVAKRIRDELEGRGVSVVMTRTDDRTVSVYDRAPACQEDCDLFVSVHVNSLPSTRSSYQRVNGFETYFLDEARSAEATRVEQMENESVRYDTDTGLVEGDPLTFIFKDLHTNEYLRESARLAELVQRSAIGVHPGGDRGVSQARFVVLGAATRPAILIETGFATNPGDASFLTSATGQSRLAEAVADGIVAYLKEYEKKVLGDRSK